MADAVCNLLPQRLGTISEWERFIHGVSSAPRALPFDHHVALGPQAIDSYLHYVFRLEITRRLGAVAHAGRGAGGDEIAHLERMKRLT